MNAQNRLELKKDRDVNLTTFMIAFYYTLFKQYDVPK